MLMSKHVEANKRPLQKKMFDTLNGGESVSKLLYHQIAKMYRTMPSTVNASLNSQKYTSLTYAGGRAARPGGYS